MDRKLACTTEFLTGTAPFMVDVVQGDRRRSLFDAFRVHGNDTADWQHQTIRHASSGGSTVFYTWDWPVTG